VSDTGREGNRMAEDYEARSLHYLSQIESLLKLLLEEIRKSREDIRHIMDRKGAA
jgi:hypothetical protein